MRTIKSGSAYDQIYKRLVNATNGVVHQCPYLPGLFNLANYTASMQHFGQFMPKGDYKLIMRIYDEAEQETVLVDVAIFWTVKIRNGDEF